MTDLRCWRTESTPATLMIADSAAILPSSFSRAPLLPYPKGTDSLAENVA